jgi:hypothetical protein
MIKKIAIVAGALLLCAPATVATPLRCADPCSIVATPNGYLLPVTEIAPGTTVAWSAALESHPTVNNLSQARCFLAPTGNNVTTSVRFDLVDAAVVATSNPGTPDEWSGVCDNASELPTGQIMLPFQCLLHPWMHGALLIDDQP